MAGQKLKSGKPISRQHDAWVRNKMCYWSENRRARHKVKRVLHSNGTKMADAYAKEHSVLLYLSEIKRRVVVQ